MGYTLWWTNSLQWKMAIEIVDFPMNSMVIFHGKLLVHQRVNNGNISQAQMAIFPNPQIMAPFFQLNNVNQLI